MEPFGFSIISQPQPVPYTGVDKVIPYLDGVAPSPSGLPTSVAPYAVVSFDPLHINTFRIGAGWNNAASRVSICEDPPGTTVDSVWRVAEPPAEDFDSEDVTALADVMQDDFARSLLGMKLEEEGYPHKFGLAGDASPKDSLQVGIWEPGGEDDHSASSGIFKRFNKKVDIEAVRMAHSGDCDSGGARDWTMRKCSDPVYQGSIDVPGNLSQSFISDIELAANRGLASAQHIYGQLHLLGLGGLAINRAEGVLYLRAAALQGHEHATAMHRELAPRDYDQPQEKSAKSESSKSE
jgi:hypothetical protein